MGQMEEVVGNILGVLDTARCWQSKRDQVAQHNMMKKQ